MPRRTKYDPKYHVPWAEGLLRRGATIDEVAREMGVAKSTVYEWAKVHKEFAEALRTSRELTDMQVEKSLYKRAMGYTATERRTILKPGPNGSMEPIRVEVNERDVPPDSSAAIFWLKNRQGWRNDPDVVRAEEVPTFTFDPESRKASSEESR